jgi:hypothetical protein
MLTKRSIAAALRSNWRTTGWMFLFATLCGCDAVPAGSSLPGLKVYTNPSDPLILSNKIATGESIEVYGERDDQGIPAKLLAAKYQSPQQDGTANATWLMFDDDGRITSLVGEDGTLIQFDWQSPTQAVVAAITGNGEHQVNTLIDFSELPGAARLRKADAARRAAADESRLGLPTFMSVTYDDPPLAASIKRRAAAKDSRCEVKINLRACGFPVENTANVGAVYVTVRRPGQGVAETFNATRTGNPGEYVACLPIINQGPGAATTAVCNGILGLSSIGCDFLGLLPANGTDEALCLFLAGSIDLATFGPTGEGAPIFAGCEAFAKAIRLYCMTIGDVPGPPGPPGLVEMATDATNFCQNVGEFLDRSSPTSDAQFTIQAVATGAGKFKATSAAQTVNANGPFPEMLVDFGGAFSVDSFLINPSNPDPGQSYTVNVRFSCVAGQRVTIKVMGTDGFTKSNSENLTGLNASLSLSVPGGAAAVMDTVTVQVELTPSDIRTFRTAIVEF